MLITDTELKLIAAAASTGLSSGPNAAYNKRHRESERKAKAPLHVDELGIVSLGGGARGLERHATHGIRTGP